MTWVTTEAERWHSKVLEFASHYSSTRQNAKKVRTECERRVLRWVLYCVSLARPPAHVSHDLLQAFLDQAHVRKTAVPFDTPMRSAYKRIIEEWGEWCAPDSRPAS